MTTKVRLIEFVGGPYDGHQELAPSNHAELEAVLAVPVNDNVFRMIHGGAAGPAAPPTSIAVYERNERNAAAPRYLFLGSTRVGNDPLHVNWV